MNWLRKQSDLAEAMTIWHMPLYKELWKIVKSGELGRVQMITMNFGSFKEYDMKNRFSIRIWRAAPCWISAFMHCP